MPSKRLDDGRWEHRLHASFLSSFSNCPEQSRIDYFDPRPYDERENTDSTACGTATHSGIEYLCGEKLQHGEVNDGDLETALDLVGYELDDMEWTSTKWQPKTVYKHARAAVTNWYHHVEPYIVPKHIEHRFKLDFYEDAERVVYLGGTVDLIDQDLHVWDWKTASRPYERWEKQRWAPQPTLYAYACAEQYDLVPPWEFTYAIMVHNGDPQFVTVWRGPEHLAWLRRQVEVIVDLIETRPDGPWPLNDAGWWCSEKWCPIFDECKGAHMQDGWRDPLDR